MSQPQNPSDSFTQFWNDFMSRMASAGMMPTGQAGNDAIKQMQRIYLDAMAKYADEYMRSPQFLDMMKQTMDASMAWKRQVDQWLSGALKAAAMPTAEDAADAVARLHSMEKRLTERLSEIEERLIALEQRDEGASAAARKRKQAGR